MILTNKQDHCVLKYVAVYFDASEEPTASINVKKTGKFLPHHTTSHARRLLST
jgi:hypothetical protein